MKIYPDKLLAAVRQQLEPLYILSGDETLLINEAADVIRQQAKEKGFSERAVFHADNPGFNWEEVLQSANSLSLFAEQKLVEVRCGKKHLNNKLFLDYCQQANPDSIILIITDKLDKSTLNTKWFKSLDPHATLVQVWPLESHHLGQWLANRARQQGLKMEPAAIALLGERVEGNLLAAAQEIEKLALLFDQQAITAELLHNAVSDSSRHDVFKLIDALLQGKQHESLTILQYLLEEGGGEFLILRTLSREIRLLTNVKLAEKSGQKPGAILQKNGVWPKRQSLYLSALKRLSAAQLKQILQQARQLDLSIMGLGEGANVACKLETLCLSLCGVHLVTA